MVHFSQNLVQLESFRSGLRRVQAQVLEARFSFLYSEQNTLVCLIDHSFVLKPDFSSILVTA